MGRVASPPGSVPEMCWKSASGSRRATGDRADPVPDLHPPRDDDLVVVDKPPGSRPIPASAGTDLTMLSGLAAANVKIATSGAAERRGIVSRLDVGTSGVMVVARARARLQRLKQAFRSRQVDKTYHTVVRGLPDPLSGTIDLSDRASSGPRLQVRRHGVGRHSVTHYELLGRSVRQPARVSLGPVGLTRSGALLGVAPSLCRRSHVWRGLRPLPRDWT